MPAYRIQFPREESSTLGQDEVAFRLIEPDGKLNIRFHDYDQIYRRPGLYEQVFYERLKCTSPGKVCKILKQTLDARGEYLSELRVLDLGAGNGIMGEKLKSHGVSRLVGVDILPEARDAAWRDRPGIYDDYYVADFTQLSESHASELRDWSFNCLTSVAALGFGDIPPAAFFRALQLIQTDGWIAFNIKDTFLDSNDTSGFSRFIRELIFSESLDIHHLEKYRHRLSMEGTPLNYFAVVARKTAVLPEDYLQRIEVD